LFEEEGWNDKETIKAQVIISAKGTKAAKPYASNKRSIASVVKYIILIRCKSL
jgi:hypothetical protein